MAVYTTIDNPELYFQVKTYTGTGSSASITLDADTDMQPDWVWIKDRDNVRDHQIYDSVRQAGNVIYSNLSNAEGDDINRLSAFNSDGFSLGTNTTVNDSSQQYVAWCWKAGTSFTNDASATGIGTIDSTGSVNTDAGFSIVSWTGDGNNGATIAHGLGVTPAIVITKRRSAVGDWLVGGSAVDTVRGGANSLLLLNTTAAMDSNSEVYQTFSSTTFQVGVNAYANTSGSTMISYCFADVQGYSKVGGSYTGNGNADGTFVYTGFKPAWLLIKRTDASGYGWSMFDNKRDPDNVVEGVFNADTSAAEDTSSDWLDFTSNGFKIRFTGGDVNSSGGSYIYMAFAENPFVTSTGVPGNAR